MHPTALGDALSTSLYLTLTHLRTISALTPTNLPTSKQIISETLHIARFQALSRLLHHLLPLISLPSAISTHAPIHLSVPITSLLQALRANATLPSILPIPPLPNYIRPYLIPLADPAFDDASTSLAQAASIDADELTDIWNRLIPDHIASTPQQLPTIIQSVKAAIATAHASAIPLDARIAHTRAVAVATLHNTLRNALTALEADTAERAHHPSPHHVYVALLCARGRAITAKLKLLRAEIAAAMYTPECARALRVIAGEVKSRAAAVESQLVQNKLRVHQYHALGDQYLQVVRELANAKRLLEHKLWARHELNTG